MRSALITFGNEESYGLLFVGGELLDFGQEIRFFDAEEPGVLEAIKQWRPDFVMFSPMTTFYPRAAKLARCVKASLPRATSVFGGHHAMATQDVDAADVVVIGPVRGSIGRILDGEVGIIKTDLTSPSDLPMPARDQYYADVPRMGYRYRKFVLSMLGCPWGCSYCSSSRVHMQELFGKEDHRRYYLKRRPLEAVIEELDTILEYPTKEIEWVDDDIFVGPEDWLLEFFDYYKKHITLPMYISTTSIGALRASSKLLKTMAPVVSAVGLGVQAARKESLKLFNRQWDSEDRIRHAYRRLASYGMSVNLQAIVGLPVSDPVEDALDTVKMIQRIGPGSVCSIYPLQVYPGTPLEKAVGKLGYKLRSDCEGDTNTGETGILFDALTTRRLRNICKLATMFVKHMVDEKWMRALLDVEFDDAASKKLSEVRYHDCVVDRLGAEGDEIFKNVMQATKLRY